MPRCVHVSNAARRQATDGGAALVDDGLRHSVTVVLGRLTAAPVLTEVGVFLQ
jgi:hypothetical protein